MKQANFNPYTDRHLGLVKGDALTRAATSDLASLAAQPFRPGEMPTPVMVQLEDMAAAIAAREASRRRLPAELWVRLAVEAGRHVRDAADAFGTTLETVEAQCDRCSADDPRAPITVDARLHQS